METVQQIHGASANEREERVPQGDDERFDAYRDFAIGPPTTDWRVLSSRHVCSQGAANGP